MGTLHYCKPLKGKWHSLERGSYRRLKLTDQILNITERIIEKMIRQKVGIDEMQFGFMPGCRTTNAPFLF